MLLDYGTGDIVDPVGDRWDVGKDDRGGSGRAEAVGRRPHELAVQNTALHHRRPPGTLREQRGVKCRQEGRGFPRVQTKKEQTFIYQA